MNKKHRLLITGSSGMVGTNISNELVSSNNYEVFLSNSKNMNLLDKKITLKVIEDFKPDFIIHCAGIVGGIQMNINSQFKSLYQNTMMYLNLIDSIDKQTNRIKFLNLGSSCIYPKNLNKEYEIDDLLTGQLEHTNEGYALAKIVGIKLLDFYKDKNFDGKSIIPCNIFGEYDSFDTESSHLLPAIIRKAHESKTNGRKIEIWGDGKARREFSFAKNLSLFVVNFLENFDDYPKNVNFGEEKDYSIKEYYDMTCEIIGCKADYKFDYERPVGMERKKVDISFQKKIGWTNPFSIQDGIIKTYDYYRKI